MKITTLLVIGILSLALLACAQQAPKQQISSQQLTQKVEAQGLLVSPDQTSMGPTDYRQIIITYKNQGTELQRSTAPKIISCTDSNGASVPYLSIPNTVKDVGGQQSVTYQTSLSASRDSKFGTYHCTMGIVIGDQLQNSPTATFTVVIK